MSDKLCHDIGYVFSNPKLLKMALTHRSSKEENNERLEFLGDAIVNFVIAEVLYLRYPHAQEGELSRRRAHLVNRDALGNLAREFDIGRYIYLGPGELKSGGNQRLSILSCTMEALIGAVYLDGGFVVTRECILRWYQSRLDDLTKGSSRKDPKTQLQEYMQSKYYPLPVYKVVSVEGELHQQIFTVSCSVAKLAKQTLGTGSSRRRAEQASADLMLESIKNGKK